MDHEVNNLHSIISPKVKVVAEFELISFDTTIQLFCH